MFSNPLFWEDEESKKEQFKKEINSLGYEMSSEDGFCIYLIHIIKV